jgi:hypothetical protein
MGGECRGRRDVFRVLATTCEGKKPLGSPSYRQENNIKMDAK